MSAKPSCTAASGASRHWQECLCRPHMTGDKAQRWKLEMGKQAETSLPRTASEAKE